jgi:miniconductance mechanosensitive channel
MRQQVPRYVARLVPLIIMYNLIPVVFQDFPWWALVMERMFNVFFVVLFIRIIRAFVHAGRNTLHGLEAFKDKPLDSYAQVINLILFIIGGVLIFSQLTGRSALTFLGAMGAASAVLLLIFKDTILGFVASIQISANNMVRIGDWITMSKYGADGDVTEINLTTVKVVNWDMTVTTIPTYALISDSFQNWRGMQEAGGRRIKRGIRIKISSIRYLTQEEIDDLCKIQLIHGYIKERSAEIERFNAENKVDQSVLVNGRRMTNVGLFRRYVDAYLASHKEIHQGMTRMVRQLASDEHGLPLELYCFTSTTKWLEYERIQSDIFDHLLSAIKYFHLQVFEDPAADDVRSVGQMLVQEGRGR